MNRQVKKAIAAIGDEAWTTIEHTDAVFGETAGRWVSRAEVAEVPFTAFASSRKKVDRVPGRLVVRRIPDFNAEKNKAAGQDTLFDVWRLHAFFTIADPKVLDAVAAHATHRHDAVNEQLHADLKSATLAHLPSRVFTANAAWLVLAVITFNLTRAAGAVAAPDLARATTAAQRRKLITVLSRVAISARWITFAPTKRMALGDRLDHNVRPGQRPATHDRGLTTQQPPLRDPRTTVEHPGQRGPAHQHALDHSLLADPHHADIAITIGGSGLRLGASPHPWGGRATAGSDPVWRP